MTQNQWRKIRCIGGPLPYMSVKWEVPQGEQVPIRDNTGGNHVVGHYVLEGDVYKWVPRAANDPR